MKIKRKYKIIILAVILVCSIFYSIYKPVEELSIQTSGKASKYKIFVDVEESKLYLFQDGELLRTYKCSGGKWSTPSPIGTWTIISKAKWGEGFGRKLDGFKCTMGTIWNTRNIGTGVTSVGQVRMDV